jgi:uncharacterized protein (TIGR02246 family)
MKNNLSIKMVASAALLIIGFISGTIYSNNSSEKVNSTILASGPELDMIQEVTNEFVDAWIRGDAEGCANTYSEDAVFMVPDQPSYRGRQVILEHYEKMFKSRVDSTEVEMAEIVNEVIFFDDWAVIKGAGYESLDSIGTKGTYKWIILSKKQSNGRWESVWDIFNDVESL